MDDVLQKYVRKFSKLRQGVTKYGPAPHKPVLLLSVLRGVEQGWIAGNRIELTPELVDTFKSIWRNLVATDHSPLIAQPFFYMRGEKFWHHVPNSGFEGWVKVSRNCQSIGVLQKAVAFVQVDPDLWGLIADPHPAPFCGRLFCKAISRMRQATILTLATIGIRWSAK